MIRECNFFLRGTGLLLAVSLTVLPIGVELDSPCWSWLATCITSWTRLSLELTYWHVKRWEARLVMIYSHIIGLNVIIVIATVVGGTNAQDYNRTRKFHNFTNQGVFNLSEIRTVDTLSIRRPKIRHPRPEGVKVECNTLRSKRYISDGFCTSVRPITEVICTGHCVPMGTLPWWSEFVKVISLKKLMHYRCVNDVVRRKRVRLLCNNGETRTYKIKVVKSCKCKRSNPLDNRSRRRYRKSRKKDKRTNVSDPPSRP